MITQKFQQGENEILIESAETLDDAKKNNFPEGVYVRYSVNGKKIESYYALVQFMAETTRKNKNKFLLMNKDELMEQRKQGILAERAEMKKQLAEIKARYGGTEYAESVLKTMDEMIEKIDEYGARIIK